MSLVFKEVNLGEWGRFERAYPGSHIFQSARRANLRSKMGYTNHIVGVYDGGILIAGGVLLGRNREFWMAYGPLIDWYNLELVQFFLKGMTNFAKEKGIVRLEIFPDLLLSTRDNKGKILTKFNRDNLKQLFDRAGYRYEGETVKYEMKAGRWAFTKDLTEIKAVEELRATYRKTLRARLRQTEGLVEVKELSRDGLEQMIGLIDESDSHHGVAGRELDYYEKMFDNLDINVRFLIAVKADDQTPIAGAIFLYNGREVASFLSGMNREYRNLNGRAWLQDYVMRDALNSGVDRVNFFWVEGNFQDNKLLEFKSGFGGVVEEYIGGFEKITRPSAYLAKRVVRKLRSILRKLH